MLNYVLHVNSSVTVYCRSMCAINSSNSRFFIRFRGSCTAVTVIVAFLKTTTVSFRIALGYGLCCE